MKNRLAIIAAAALLMTGCGTAAETTDAETTAEAVSAEAEATETTTEQPSGETTENEAPEEKTDVRDILSPRERLGDEPSDSPDWVTALPQAENAEQVFVVAGYDTSSEWISMHEKDDPGCTAFPYVKATDSTYWSGDPAEGMQYNSLVENIDDLPGLDPDECEHIFDYQYEYQYCLNISYNEEGTPGLGSAIFLHCLGSMKPRTGGCVAIPEDNMRYVMKHVDSECVIVIDTMDALGAEF